MKLQVCPPSVLEATDVQANSKEGLMLRPLFYGAGKDSVGAIIRVMSDEGNLVSQAVLKISGDTGKVSLQDRTMPVPPAMERKEHESAGKPAAPGKGE